MKYSYKEQEEKWSYIYTQRCVYKYLYLRDYLHTSANNQRNDAWGSETKYK